ncbi:MAG: DNA replication/repair protein RecF [Candidatus Sumerlaeaceae bacterium]|nr:DNA replication/repair protein RecF [Candidatus Sumerlaeaceae bacterium]
MIVRELQIINFRNLRSVRSEFGPGINLIYGANAQGKTNLLEALSLLVTARSFRTSAERELIPWVRDGYEATLIRARVERLGGEDRLLMTFNQGEKHVFVNGTPLARLGDLLGRLNAVIFTPPDLGLVSGGPAGRRRFLDIGLSQTSRPYLVHLQHYDLALRQANALLKQHQRRPSLRDELAAWHDKLAAHGGALLQARAAMISELSALAGQTYAAIAGVEEPLRLEYLPSPSAVQAQPDAAEAALREALERCADDDMRRGAISSGPHRDDFRFLVAGRDARDFGSQGQQRSCVLALKLAEMRRMTSRTGDPPLLLLDDLMSELDESRQRALLASLDPCVQTFITATERSLVAPLVECRGIYLMDDGQLTREL